jgi:hypothetical protein
MSAANPTSLPPPGGFRELGKLGEFFFKTQEACATAVGEPHEHRSEVRNNYQTLAWTSMLGHDTHKASRWRLHARLAYVVRVDNRASVAHVAATPAV